MTGANVNIVDLVVERIKNDPIGGIIKEEDLYDIVKQGIEKTFFSERKDPNSSPYNQKWLPPLIVSTLEKSIAAHVAKAVDRWVAENADTVLLPKLQKALDDGIVQAAENVLHARAREAAAPLVQVLVGAINEQRRTAGLPELYVPY